LIVATRLASVAEASVAIAKPNQDSMPLCVPLRIQSQELVENADLVGIVARVAVEIRQVPVQRPHVLLVAG